MDPRLGEAARALAACDPLAALGVVALRNDAPALALRGIAMAQLGEFTTARKLLGRAAKAFEGVDEAARGRCLAAEAEVLLACRDLPSAGRALDAAVRILDAEGDHGNALFVRLQLVRRLVLLGELNEATKALRALDLERAPAPARLIAAAELVRADIAMLGLRAKEAQSAIERARIAARFAKIPSLVTEVDQAAERLAAPIARLSVAGTERVVVLAETEAFLRSGDLIVDACRRTARAGKIVVPLVTRPVLFALIAALGDAAPRDASRDELVRRAFGAKRSNDSYRSRLRVEIGRLRAAISAIAEVRATPSGFCLLPRRGSVVRVLHPPTPGEASTLLALLGGGESWSTSALAAALGKSQRTVQRALGELLDAGRIQAIGRGRSRRWVAPPPSGFATTLLLAARVDSGAKRRA
jgi:hypothetical protein